jgi:hypothetical protein
MNIKQSRVDKIVDVCQGFGTTLAPHTQELVFQLAEAITSFEFFIERELSDCCLLALSVEVERILNRQTLMFSAISDDTRVAVLLTLINYLKVVNGSEADDVDITGGFSSVLKGKHTRFILDDIRDELIFAVKQGNPNFERISKLISSLAKFDAESAERLRDITDITNKEVYL